jgi:peptidyl-prolyl cis-trans isomerase SurA
MTAGTRNGRRQAMMTQPAISTLTRVTKALTGAVFAAFLAQAAAAQSSPFAPVRIINDMVISQYELDQRVIFLTLLRQPGDPVEEALKGLTQDKLQLWSADQLGITVTPEQIKAGMEEFAARANLTADKFVEAIGQAGMDAESFRDFVKAGLVWREVVRGKFGPTVSISEAEIDRALAAYVPTTIPQVDVSEIVIPATGDGRNAALALARKLKIDLSVDGDFEAAARAHSAGPTAGSGGHLAPLRLTSLPKEAIAVVRRLKPDQVSEPVVMDDEVRLYKLHAITDETLSGPGETVVDYALYALPSGQDAASLRARVDSCDDLYTEAKGQPEANLLRESHPVSAVPADIAAALTLLDAGESTTIQRGGAPAFLMLCRRGSDVALQPLRDDVRAQLMNQRLAALAEIYMEELRSEAIIREP